MAMNCQRETRAKAGLRTLIIPSESAYTKEDTPPLMPGATVEDVEKIPKRSDKAVKKIGGQKRKPPVSPAGAARMVFWLV